MAFRRHSRRPCEDSIAMTLRTGRLQSCGGVCSIRSPEGPSTQYPRTWVSGNSHHSNYRFWPSIWLLGTWTLREKQWHRRDPKPPPYC